VRHTSPSRIYETKVRLPPLPTQKKIAALLSAYDDLIENNERRIRILEEMAQNLYREWFVKFRFPGHKKVKMVDSPLGKIPQGWEVLAIGDLSEFLNRGVSPKYDDSSGLTVINQKCIRNGRLSLAESRKHCTKVPEGKGVRFGDVLINSTGVGTLGRVAQVYVDLKDCTVDSHVTIVRPASTTVNVDYFGFALCDMQPAFERMGAGATNQTELGRQRIAESLLLSPPDNLQKMFSEAVQPVRRLSMNLCKRNDALRQTRDLLLSKLISGEVDVSELDIRIPENAA
jgi:type I restriction enzyme S subunit